MNKIYKIIWNAARGCYVVASELARNNRKKSSTRSRKSLRAFVLLSAALLSGGVSYADVVVRSDADKGTVTKETIPGGTRYDIRNQQVSGDGNNALNRFTDFDISKGDVANLQLEKVNHQINLVDNKINIDGVVNAIKDNQIGGNVYFFSSNGIAVGESGVFNVGRLTLGTNTTLGSMLYDYSLDSLSLKDLSGTLVGTSLQDAAITMNGTVNAKNGVVIATPGTVTIGSGATIRTGAVFNALPSAGSTADSYRAPFLNTDGITTATTASKDTEGIVLLSNKNMNVSGQLESHGRNISIEARKEGNLSIDGGKVYSDGGKIALTATTDVADLQADPDHPEHGGIISIKEAYIDSGSQKQKSGDIEVSALRTSMGVTGISVDATTMDAGGKNGNQSGNVAIHATAQTALESWDIGDGTYARIHMGQQIKDKKNTIIGDNISVRAQANNDGSLADRKEMTEAEFAAAFQDTLGFFDEKLTDFRLIGAITKIHSEADVNIDYTDMKAIGTGADTEKHGDISIASHATSYINTTSFGIAGLGMVVGISDAQSHVDVDNSTLYAQRDLKADATADNRVTLTEKEMGLVQRKAEMNFTYGKLTSDVGAHIGKDATVTTGRDTEVSALSTRRFEAEVSNNGNISAAIAIGLVDTHANASIDGTVYAAGDVKVAAENTQHQTESGVYEADRVGAAARRGDGALKPVITLGKETAGQLFKSLKQKFGFDAGGAAEKQVNNEKSFFNKLGINAATSFLSSNNTSNASVTGTIRGAKESGGVYVGDMSIGAKSLTAAANTISRAHAETTAFENMDTKDGEQTAATYTAAVAFSYLSEENHATAYVGDGADVKTTGDVTVKAETKMPWQTYWQGTSAGEIADNLRKFFMKSTLGLPELVDSWSQTAGKADEASGAVSVSLVNYDNSATAYIGKSDSKKDAPTVVAGGDVNVNAKTDTTTVNFAGSIPQLLDYAPGNVILLTPFGKMSWEEILNEEGWSMGASNSYGLGGSVLRVHQTNTTKAYIDDGASVTVGKSVNVLADTVARNLAISAAGGKAKSVAFDSTVTMGLFDNDTKAYIGNATVKADDDVKVEATDDSWDINFAGAVGGTGAVGIGASIAYNHISRETEAYINGIVNAADKVSVNARNDGYIASASLAGAVAYDGTDRPTNNHSGAWGDHVRPQTEQEQMDGLAGLLPEWEEEVGGEGGNLQDEVNEIVQEVGGADNAMGDNVAEAAQEKNKMTVAANLSINRMTDTAKAHVGNGSAATQVSAKALDISALNDSSINAITGVVSANMSAEQGKAIGGSFMWNSAHGTTEAYVNSANLTLSGDDKEDKALTVSAHNKERVLNVAASGSGTGQGIAGAGQISVNKIDDTTKAYVKDSTIQAAKAMTIKAMDEGTLDSYTGAVAFSGGGTGTAIGAAIAVNLVSGDTKAYAEDNTIGGVTNTEGEKTTTKKGSLAVTAESKTKVSAVAASGAVANEDAGSFSAVGSKVSTTAEAHLTNGKSKTNGAYAIDVDALTVSALNHSTATTGVGALGAGSSAVGASIGVMVHDSTARAYVEGDEEKKNTLKTSALTIKAENAYNGDAKDSEDDSTSKTVAIGAAGGASRFSGAGSVTVNKITQTTDAYLGKGNFDVSNGTDNEGKSVNGAASITAKSSAKLFGLAGGLSLSGGNAIGAGVDIQAYDSHTDAGIRDGARLSHASSTTVEADSSETLTSIGAAGAIAGGTVGGAGAAGAHSITTHTKAYIGENKENGKGATLTDAGDVKVHGSDDTTLKTGSGAAGGTAGTVGVGLSAAVEVVNKTVESLVGSSSTVQGKSLSVLAKNKGSSTTAAAALGIAGTAGVAGAASETFVDYTTKAHVGKAAKVTTDGAASVKADSSFKQGAGAGGAGVGGSWGLGVTNSTVSYTATTLSYVDTGAAMDSETIDVEADQKTDVTFATVAGAGGGNVAINGAIGVNVLDTTTKAYAGDSTKLTAKEKIAITAKDETILDGGNGGLSVGVAAGGGGMALGVSKVIKDTEAFTGTGALLNTTGDDAGNQISISAKNAEAIRNITIQGAGGMWAGVAGAVNLNYITATTKAYTGSNTSLIQGAITYDDDGAIKEITKTNGTVSVDATHDIGSAITRIDSDSTLAGMTSVVVGGTGSAGGSIGATVDAAVVNTRTQAYLGNANTVKSQGALSVVAKEEMKDISSTSLAASIGSVGLTGSFSIYNFGNDLTDDDKKALTAKAEAGGADTTLTAWLDKELKNTNISEGFTNYDSGALTAVKEKLGTEYTSAAPTMEGGKGTLASIGGAANVDAGSVTVGASDRITMDQKMGNVSGSLLVSAGATVTRVTTDTATRAEVGDSATVSADKQISISASSDHHLESHVGGAAISAIVAAEGTVSTWNDNAKVHTTIGANSELTAGEAVRITSANSRSMNSALVGATAALYGAVNGAVIYSSIEGEALTTIGDGVQIQSKKTTGDKTTKDDIVIDASADTTLIAGAVGAALGAFGGTGTGTSLSSAVTAKTTVGNKANIEGKNISITAENTPILKATATSAGLGLAGVGITVAKTDSKDKAQVVIGNTNTLTADEVLTVKAAMKKPTSTDGDHAFGLNGYASATAGAGGVVSGAVATAFVDEDQVTSVEIGSGNTLRAKTTAITADHQDAANVVLNTISAGALTGMGGQMGTTVKSDAHVTIGDGSAITTTDETKILASNDTEKAWRDGDTPNAMVGGAGLAAGAGVVNETTITHDTKVNLGKVTIQANAADLTDAEKATGVTLYDRNAIDINATSKVVSKDDLNLTTGAAILSSYANNKNTVTANTGVTVGDGADLKAGDTEEIKETHTESYAEPSGKSYTSSYRGGSIAIGTRNDAELDSSTMVDIYGAAGHAGSSNEVTYNNNLTTTFGGTAETAKGDIAIHAGRDTTGATGTVKVTARSDVLNATLIPLSYTYDPTATVNGKAQLTLTGAADLKSDRDISLKAKTGDVTARGYGETKSWVNSIKDIFGEGVSIGKTVKNSTANVEVNGKAETGIHRNKTIQMGGHIDAATGKWVTTVSGNGDISYSFSNSHAGGSDLYDQYEALKQKLEEYSADPAAKAGYEAEMKFLQQKMVEQGLAYLDEKGNFVLVKNAGSTPEIESAKTQLETLKTQQQETIKGLDTVLEILDKEEPLLEDMLQKYNAAMDAKKDYGETSTEYAKATAAYAASVKKHNEEMGNTYYSADISSIQSGDLDTDLKELEGLHNYYSTLKDQWEKSTEITRLDTQISATEKFFTNGGVENTTTGGFTLNGHVVEAVDADGKAVDPKTAAEGTEYYYLLHKESYNYLIHDLELGGITSQLGDIDMEGDNVYGTGSLTAHGDGSVAITNNSPNNLKVGDITIAGSAGTSGAGQGGTIYFNNSALRGDAETVKNAIKNLNVDATKSVGFGTVETRDTTELPSVEIKNDFKPNEHLLGNMPVFGPSQTYLTGYIYNPRGSVHGISQYGDMYNRGSILSGTVNLEVKNGDYIQSYDLEKSGTVTNIGGAPLTDTGAKKDSVGEGITANGNIFISARYLNINSKIQSGYSDVKIHIPENYKLYYMSGETKVYVTSKDQLPTDRSVIVHVEGDGLSDEGAKLLTFDFDADSFLVNDVETGGGHISLVGTILNTTADTSKAKLEARDGYGNITIVNDSAKDLQLQGLSTGSGAKGVIEITDLDYGTGKITRKTTYTRGEDGQIQAVVEEYNDGTATGKSSTTIYDGAATYNPDTAGGKGLWYNYQTGKQTSYTATYKFDGSKFDWWGINNRDPSVEEMEQQGEKISDTTQGKTTALNGGAFISNAWQNGTIQTNTDDYKVSTNTSTMDKQVVGFYKEAYRPFWTLWLTKKYNYTLVEKKTDLQVTQSSIKADNPIGISFTGSADGGVINVTNTRDTNIRINGLVQNGEGSMTLTAGAENGSIIQESPKGFIYTRDLTLVSGGNAGKEGAAIVTNAQNLTATSKNGQVAVSVEENVGDAVTVGNISAKTIASIASDGSIRQKEGTAISARRIELMADDAIYGQETDTGHTALITELTDPDDTDGTDFYYRTDDAYGLYARANGDIYIRNTQYEKDGALAGGDMYIDSVISGKGNVALETEGSFLDANFTDQVNQSAADKLLHWAKEAVLEKSDATIEKQKAQMQATVEGKYNQYLSLKSHVKDGTYVLDDATRAMLVEAGYDDKAIAKYCEDQQVRYNQLLNEWHVDTWTEEDVTNYVNSLDSNLFGNADLTVDDLAADKFLSQQEKANCLVNSAKSAEQLLITFVPGGIKEGITDTRLTVKTTPNVSGAQVSLSAEGKKNDGVIVSGSGSIGQKLTDQVIDISTEEKIKNLTAAELLMLSSAERGDFSYDEKEGKVTVSFVNAITADTRETTDESGSVTGGTISANANAGAIYLDSNGAFHKGSSFYSSDELRLKTSGDLAGITAGVGAGKNLVLESADGGISDVTIRGEGILTARAKDGVSVSKEDGDLIIYTVYASDGDVTIDMKDKGSLYSVSGIDSGVEEGDVQIGTPFLNVEGRNIYIFNAQNVKGITDPVTKNPSTSMGLKATGTVIDVDPDAAPITQPGQIQIRYTADESGKPMVNREADVVDVTLFGDTASEETDIGGRLTTITNKGTLTAGKFSGSEKLTIYNTHEGVIKADENTTAPTFTGGGNKDSETPEADGITLINHGVINGASFTAEGGSLTVTNDGSEKEDAGITDTTFKAAEDIHYTGRNQAALQDATLEAGNEITVHDEDNSSISIEKLHAGLNAQVQVDRGSLTLKEATADKGSLTISAQGTVSGGTRTESGDTATGLTAATDIIIKSSGGDLDLTTVKAGNDITLTAGTEGETGENAITADKVETAKGVTTITDYGNGKLTVKKLLVGSARETEGTADAVNTITGAGDVELDYADIYHNGLTVTAGGALKAGDGTAAKDDWDISSLKGDITLQSQGQMDIAKVYSKEDIHVTSADAINAGELYAAKDIIVTGNGEGKDITIQKLLSVGSSDITSKGSVTVDSASAGHVVGADTHFTITADKDIAAREVYANSLTFTAGENAKVDGARVTRDLTITAGGTLTAGTGDSSLSTETGDLTLRSDGAMEVTKAVSGGDLVANSGSTLTADTLKAQGTADLDSTGDLYVKALDAKVADIQVTEGNAKVDTANTGEKISITTVKGNIETGSVTTKDADYNAGGTLEADTITASGTADLDSAKGLHVKTLGANIADIQVTEGNAKVDTANTGEKISITTVKGNIETGSITTKDADYNASGTLEADTITASGVADLDSNGDLYVKALDAKVADIQVTEGNAKVDTANTGEKISITTVKGNIETGSVTTKDADYNAGGTLEADTITASGVADLDSVGDLHVKNLYAGEGDIDVTGGDAKVDVAVVENVLSIDASHNIETGSTETVHGSTVMHAENDISIGTLTSGEHAVLEAKKGSLTAESITANENATLTSGDAMQVESLISKGGNIYGISGGVMTMGTVKAESKEEGKGRVTLISKSTMDVDSLTAQDADLTSEDSMKVWDSQISHTLQMNSGKDIIVNRSDSVTLTMKAGGSIKAETHDGESAAIHTGEATMEAGEDILITSREPVEKLDGVDTSEPAGKVSGAGEAGSLYLADATPSTFDVSKKGSAVLSVDKALTMTGKNVEVDTLSTGADSITSNADNLGIDDLQSSADKLHVIIHGSDGESQSHYAGLHTTSDGTVVVKDSRIETLRFTGKDHLGIEDTALGGDSTMQNSLIRFELRKNPRTDMAEWISRIHLNGYGIDTDHPMSRVDDGIPINGDPNGETAYSAMNRSLYGRDYLGKDGREKEEDEGETASLRFGEVSPKETYDTVGK